MPVRSPSYYATVAAPYVKQILVGNIWVRIAWVAQRLVASGESGGKVVFFFDVEKIVVKNAAAAAWLAMTLKNCFFAKDCGRCCGDGGDYRIKERRYEERKRKRKLFRQRAGLSCNEALCEGRRWFDPTPTVLS